MTTSLRNETETLQPTTSGSSKSKDLLFLSLLLGITACVALTLRGDGFVRHVWLVALAVLGWLGTALVWINLTQKQVSTEKNSQPKLDAIASKQGSWGWLAIATFLFALTIAAFFLPLRKLYWAGYDEATYFVAGKFLSYCSQMDSFYNRPFGHVHCLIAHFLTPFSIDGYLYLTIFSRFASGLALWGILRELLPRQSRIALIAAVLFIINPAEPLRYMIVAMSGYYLTCCVLLMAIWAYLASYRRENRSLLLISCATLAVALLGANEGGYPTAVIVPILLLLMPSKQFSDLSISASPLPDHGQKSAGASIFPFRFSLMRQPALLAWVYAWMGTIAVLAARFIMFLLGKRDAYQFTAGASAAPHSVNSIAQNIYSHLEPICRFISLDGVSSYWPYGLVVSAVVLIMLLVLQRHQTDLTTKSKLTGTILSAIAILLGIAAYLNFGDVSRTQFYAAAAQATLLAFAIEWIATVVPKALRPIGACALASAIVFTTCCSSMAYQDRPGVPFERVVRTFQQANALAGGFLPGTLVIFDLTEKAASLGANYSLALLCQLAWPAVVGLQTNVDDPYYAPVFEAKQVTLNVPATCSGPSVTGIGSAQLKQSFAYSRIAAMTVSPRGDIVLLKQLPKRLQNKDFDPATYNPKLRMASSDQGHALPYLKRSWWMVAEAGDDIFSDNLHLVLASGWYPFERWNGTNFRWANNDAEVIVPATKQYSDLEFDLELGPSVGMDQARLQALDEEGHEISTMMISGRQTFKVSLPAQAFARTIKLHVNTKNQALPGDARMLNLRVFKIILDENASAKSVDASKR